MSKRPYASPSETSWFEKMYSGTMSQEYKRYMRTEWAMEKRGDVPLFEKLSLEGAQAGLSWATILSKRPGYRNAFYGFDLKKCAAMNSADVDRLLGAETATIVRHRGKVESVVNNAKCVLALIEEAEDAGTPLPPHGHFDAFIWSFVGGRPQLNSWESGADIPSVSDTATEMSKAMKKRGFKFVGPTCCYSFMQSCGLVIDHPVGTPEWKEARARLAGRSEEQEPKSAVVAKKKRREGSSK